MATNWPPTASYPTWPPVELHTTRLVFSSIQAGIASLQSDGFTWDTPTAQEDSDYFRNVRCDEGHPCKGIMIVSPGGLRYPFAYCVSASHRSALVLWVVGIDQSGQSHYDLGNGSGVI